MKYVALFFLLSAISCSNPVPKLMIEHKDGRLIIRSGETDLLSYQYETVYPPIGVDSAFQRSAFIHPLKTPHGQTLTRIQPRDHYHHYGIWNPWSHVLFEGDTIDFWNLKKRQGTVRFVKFDTIYSDQNYAEFQSTEAHVAYPYAQNKIALKERKTVRVSAPNDDAYTVDIRIELECGSESPFRILKYRYGGFAYRAIEEWDDKTSEILTSAGKNRADADATTARWCIARGVLGDEYGGMVLMSHPDNHNHPEPLRLWAADKGNQGQLYINISPTKFEDWLLEPGKTYVLKYRLLVFNGTFGKEEAEKAWVEYGKKLD